VNLLDVVHYCNQYLRVDAVHDYPEALNGLQVGNRGTVTRIAGAVDLCAATVRMAAKQQADLLLVHHGLFWGGLRPIVGPQLERVAGLIRDGIAVYGAHLPLDCHPDIGNAVLLARALGVSVRGDFGTWQDQPVGLWGEGGGDRDSFSQLLTEVLGAPAKAMLFGPTKVGRVGIVTGAGGSFIKQAALQGLDTFVTGEGSHDSYFDAQELGLNVYFGGHYATETFGVRALAEHLGTKFGIPWVFLDHPTGL
jgi:dinuclear metal center YbgI/SA1388 family protein